MTDQPLEQCVGYVKDGAGWSAEFVVDGRRYPDRGSWQTAKREAVTTLNRLRITAAFETAEIEPTGPPQRLPTWEQYRDQLTGERHPAWDGVSAGTAVTFYATVDDGFPRERPMGLHRRIHTTPPTDQVFAGDLAWHPSEYLARYWLGHNDIDHVELTVAEAKTIIDRRSAER